MSCPHFRDELGLPARQVDAPCTVHLELRDSIHVHVHELYKAGSRARPYDEQTRVQSLHALRGKLVSCSHNPIIATGMHLDRELKFKKRARDQECLERVAGMRSTVGALLHAHSYSCQGGKWPIPISNCEPTVPRDCSKNVVFYIQNAACVLNGS